MKRVRSHWAQRDSAAAIHAGVGPSRAGKLATRPGRGFPVPGSSDPKMSTRFYYAAPRKSKSLSGSTRPMDLRGRPATGRISSMLVGQGHGQIRRRDGQMIFFHRADLQEGTAFNDLQV